MIAKVLTLFDPFAVRIPFPALSFFETPRWMAGAATLLGIAFIVVHVLMVNFIVGTQYEMKAHQAAIVQLENQLAEKQALMLEESAKRIPNQEEASISLEAVGSDITFVFANPRIVEAAPR